MLTVFIQSDGKIKICEYDIPPYVFRVPCGPYRLLMSNTHGLPENTNPIFKNVGEKLYGDVVLAKVVKGQIVPLGDTMRNITIKVAKWVSAMRIINRVVDMGEKFADCHYDEKNEVVTTSDSTGKFNMRFDLNAKSVRCYRIFREVEFDISLGTNGNIREKYEEAKKSVAAYFRRRNGKTHYFDDWIKFVRIAKDTAGATPYYDVAGQYSYIKFMNITFTDKCIINFGNVKMNPRKRINSRHLMRITHQESLRWSYGAGMGILLDYIASNGGKLPDSHSITEVCANGVIVDNTPINVTVEKHQKVFVKMEKNGFEMFAEFVEGSEMLTMPPMHPVSAMPPVPIYIT